MVCRVGVRQVRTGRGRPGTARRGLPRSSGFWYAFDGRLGHEGFEAQVRDGRRDRRGAGSGWLTLRAFWPDVAVTPCLLATEVGADLRRPRLARSTTFLPARVVHRGAVSGLGASQPGRLHPVSGVQSPDEGPHPPSGPAPAYPLSAVALDILVPYWGDPDLMRETVESVFAQERDDWQLLVVDDAYPDPQVSEWLGALDDPRVTVVRHETNIGITSELSRVPGAGHAGAGRLPRL